jgi:uncharacterized membrane protein
MTIKFVTLPPTVPPLPRAVDRRRNLPLTAPFGWLVAGWRDLTTQPAPSLVYGLGIATLSALVVASMFVIGWALVLFPALAGFLVVGPVLATGLYEKSRRLAAGEAVSLGAMMFPGRDQGVHIAFIGVVLMGLMLLWMRAAVLLYALFFGWRAFPGFDHILELLFGTPLGLTMLATGTFIGGLFAAFGFAVSAFSVPMLLDKRCDALTAMGTSMALVFNNISVMLVWGVIVLGLTIVSIATAFVGLIVVFPLLGHATWHAYAAIRD